MKIVAPQNDRVTERNVNFLLTTTVHACFYIDLKLKNIASPVKSSRKKKALPSKTTGTPVKKNPLQGETALGELTNPMVCSVVNIRKFQVVRGQLRRIRCGNQQQRKLMSKLHN